MHRLINPPPVEGHYAIPRSVRLSVRLSHDAAALGYRDTGCLQLRHVRTADPSGVGRSSAASRTAIGGEGAYRLAAPGAITCLHTT